MFRKSKKRIRVWSNSSSRIQRTSSRSKQLPGTKIDRLALAGRSKENLMISNGSETRSSTFILDLLCLPCHQSRSPKRSFLDTRRSYSISCWTATDVLNLRTQNTMRHFYHTEIEQISIVSSKIVLQHQNLELWITSSTWKEPSILCTAAISSSTV